MHLIPTTCAICEVDHSEELYPANFSSKDLTQETFSARRIPDRVHYRIVRCKNCGLVYSNPILPQKIISQLYRESTVTYDEQTKSLCETYWQYFLTMISTVRGVASQHLGRASPKSIQAARGVLTGKHKTSPRVLEIGCGNGFFLEYLMKHGWGDVWGVEPSTEAISKAPKTLKRRIVNAILKPNLFKKASFDVICAFQTLDHITDPNAFLRICYALLKPGGNILVINHDVSSWSAKLLGEKSPIIDIEHIYLFNKETLSRIFTKNDFTVESVFTIIDQHRLGHWLRMLPIQQDIKSILTRLSDAIGLSRLSVQIPAGNIGIVVSKQL